MKKTKRIYHYAVRKLKREKDSLSRQRMAESLSENITRNFWSEVNKVSRNGIASSMSIGDMTDPFEIASHFENQYNTLFNSVPSDPSRIEQIKYDINDRCVQSHLIEMIVDINDIKRQTNT